MLNLLTLLIFLCIKKSPTQKQIRTSHRLSLIFAPVQSKIASLHSLLSFRNGAFVVFRPQFAFAYANANSVFTPAVACLRLLAVHNFYTSLLFFYRKTALRQVVHKDVASPRFVRPSHLPKSAKKSLF